jgi:hypothetical protein
MTPCEISVQTVGKCPLFHLFKSFVLQDELSTVRKPAPPGLALNDVLGNDPKFCEQLRQS